MIDTAKICKEQELETVLSRGLVDFIHTESLMSVRRLLPGDLKVIYNRTPTVDPPINNPFGSSNPKPDEDKGGVQLNDFLSTTSSCTTVWRTRPTYSAASLWSSGRVQSAAAKKSQGRTPWTRRGTWWGAPGTRALRQPPSLDKRKRLRRGRLTPTPKSSIAVTVIPPCI